MPLRAPLKGNTRASVRVSLNAIKTKIETARGRVANQNTPAAIATRELAEAVDALRILFERGGA